MNKNKKAQFYLITAIIIISIIVGFATLSNYTKKESQVRIYDLGDELGIESGQVIDYGIYNQFNPDKNQELLQNFTTLYSEYAGSEKSLYFVFGNPKRDTVTVATYQEALVGTISVDVGAEDGPIRVPQSGNQYTAEEYNLTGETDTITVTIGDVDYPFELLPGENFYFVIIQEVEGETHITTSENERNRDEMGMLPDTFEDE